MKIEIWTFLGFLILSSASSDKLFYKVCVPSSVFPACNALLTSRANEKFAIDCIVGRDRYECLDIIKKQGADLVALDPEDLYIASKKGNEDFTVFADIRTKELEKSEYKYEGIIIARKSAGIKSLADLKGKKSCHTGYGRAVGYKVPILKLKKHGLFKNDDDLSLSPSEREIKAFSEFFTKSCLVGKYSMNPEVNEKMKKTYPNLCALCEDPKKCDYPDKFSGYDGAILCLDKNGGDVAFTKVRYVQKYFGLPVGHAEKSLTEAQGNPNDYEYVCENGGTVPITGPACTWAQRPWPLVLGNKEFRDKNLEKLQEILKDFYEEVKTDKNKELAKKLYVEDDRKLIPRVKTLQPEEHLVNAQYKDLIERQIFNGTTDDEIIRLCVTNNVELKKCKVLSEVAFSRDVRPNFKCIEIEQGGCPDALRNNKVDAFIVQTGDYSSYNLDKIKPIMFEKIEDDEKFVVVADEGIEQSEIRKATLNFDTTDLKINDAALFFLSKQNKEEKECINTLKSDPNGKLKVMSSKELSKQVGKVLVCVDLSTKPLSEYKDCHFSYTVPGAVYVNQTLKPYREDAIKYAFLTLSNKFGRDKPFETSFKLFGEFEKGEKNILFNDKAVELVESQGAVKIADYKKLHCLN
ncbi:hypothetical protein PVAND_005823 [Polypedilum vanderplanki]|uniref:Transferrin n=1 Tax=Polypedilum vanderplanki TaxID=319348 RepID=A0A9J6C1P8_POLVA|nr:hypothetical protein PVAND_005823 [Polypedilum vanderplanki]